LELLKAELAEIELEKKEEKAKKAEAEAKERLDDKAPILIDKAAPIESAEPAKVEEVPEAEAAPKEVEIEVSTKDIDTPEDIIEEVAREKKINIDVVQVKELRENMAELLQHFATVQGGKDQAGAVKVTKAGSAESRVNRFLKARVAKMLNKAEEQAGKLQDASAINDTVRIDELLTTLRRLNKVAYKDEARLKRIVEMLDEDKDGVVSVTELLKVVDLLDDEAVEGVKLSSGDAKDVKTKGKAVKEGQDFKSLLELIRKEERLEGEEKKEREKKQQQATLPPPPQQDKTV